MTYREANKLLLMLQYNFAGFYPQDVQGIAVKKGTWTAELIKYDYKPAEDVVKLLIQTAHFPPQLADFRELVGQRAQRDPVGIPGPTFGTEEGNEAMYTADPEHVKQVFEELMRDLT